MNTREFCYSCFKEKPGNSSVCPHCGYDSDSEGKKYPLALPCGTELNKRYILGRVLGQGGFGITYLAMDSEEEQLVAVKEYYPEGIASRSQDGTVQHSGGELGEIFSSGKNSFLEEARTLAQFTDCPNIVSVYSLFEQNETAYFVMEYVKGVSLLEYIREHGGKLSWDDAARILFPVMDALSLVHSKGIIHRDVTPENIYVTENDEVRLLDFGSARYSYGDRTRSLSVVLKYGYAPKEQYVRRGKQGFYTDVYSLAATLYFALTGHKPPEAIERMDEDDLIPPSNLGVKLSAEAEDALLKGLAVNAADRYQTVAEFKAALSPKANLEPSPTVMPEMLRPAPTVAIREEEVRTAEKKSEEITPVSAGSQKPSSGKKRKKGLIAGILAVALMIVLVGGIVLWKWPSSTDMVAKSENSEEQTFSSEESSSSKPETQKLIYWGISSDKEVLYLADKETKEIAASATDLNGSFLSSMSFSEDNLPPWHGQSYSIRKVIIQTGIGPKHTDFWFKGMGKLTAIENSNNLNVSQVVSMASMFMNCHSLTSLDISKWNTGNVQDMSRMFSGCLKLEKLYISDWDTSNVTSMYAMFFSCQNLQHLDINGIDTSSVTDMGEMFATSTGPSCFRLQFDTSSVVTMHSMFEGFQCDELILTGFNNRSTEDMGEMFRDCSANKIDLEGFGTPNVTNMSIMFAGCSADKIDLDGFDTSNVTDMSGMFSGCSASEILLDSFDTSKVETMKSMFHNCSSLSSLRISHLTIAPVYDGMFDLSSDQFSGELYESKYKKKFDKSKARSIPVYISQKQWDNYFSSITPAGGYYVRIDFVIE